MGKTTPKPGILTDLTNKMAKIAPLKGPVFIVTFGVFYPLYFMGITFNQYIYSITIYYKTTVLLILIIFAVTN